ncbi:MAG TPA: response regulator [Chloroflexi bacterium]|nr:response regulator [Chloroflexota bacterium]
MSHSVLVVEDDEQVRRLLCDMVSLMGFNSVEAVDGQDAMRKLQQQKPDIMLLDVMMPKMVGIALCKTLRNEEGTAHLPIIMLSVQSRPFAILEGLRAGADRFLTKPTGLDELTGHINELLGRRQLEA